MLEVAGQCFNFIPEQKEKENLTELLLLLTQALAMTSMAWGTCTDTLLWNHEITFRLYSFILQSNHFLEEKENVFKTGLVVSFSPLLNYFKFFKYFKAFLHGEKQPPDHRVVLNTNCSYKAMTRRLFLDKQQRQRSRDESSVWRLKSTQREAQRQAKNEKNKNKASLVKDC